MSMKNKKKVTQFPPRRGQVKSQIFESIVKSVASVASRLKKRWPKMKVKVTMERVAPLEHPLHLKAGMLLKEIATS
ncbi:Detected protein of unknown function [Hibiscus syriacus]|uniref:Uncharacterized protein n=1 Tax=Hibiscus syriacus TaxID=106335 RepID=A0A6A3CLE2_HIBSY|nr:Detected protein of unknown function [Hibiscus syriacus]